MSAFAVGMISWGNAQGPKSHLQQAWDIGFAAGQLSAERHGATAGVRQNDAEQSRTDSWPSR